MTVLAAHQELNRTADAVVTALTARDIQVFHTTEGNRAQNPIGEFQPHQLTHPHADSASQAIRLMFPSDRTFLVRS